MSKLYSRKPNIGKRKGISQWQLIKWCQNKGGNNKTIWKREVKINSVIGENISLVNSAFDDL